MNELAFGGKPAKIYTAGIISVATYFGGPLAAGYLISRNFKVFGKEDHARNAFYLGILATILLIGFFLMVPERYIEIIPRSLFPMTYTGLVYWIVYQYQGDAVEAHLAQGEGLRESGWKAAGIGLVCLVLTVALAMPLALFQPLMEGEKINVGELKHEVYYGSGVTPEQAQQVAGALSEAEFFDMDFQTYLKIEKSDSGGYKLLFPVEKRYWEDQMVRMYYWSLREDLRDKLGQNVEIRFFEDGMRGWEETGL